MNTKKVIDCITYNIFYTPVSPIMSGTVVYYISML